MKTSEEKTLARDQNAAHRWRNSTAGLKTNGVIFTLIILHNSPPNLILKADQTVWRRMIRCMDGNGEWVWVWECVLVVCNFVSVPHSLLFRTMPGKRNMIFFFLPSRHENALTVRLHSAWQSWIYQTAVVCQSSTSSPHITFLTVSSSSIYTHFFLCNLAWLLGKPGIVPTSVDPMRVKKITTVDI